MATYAGRYDEALIRRVGDRPAFPASGTTVLVYESDGSTTATLYTDRTKATTADNPVEPDASGNLEFFAEPGTYVLSIREDGTEVATDTVTVHLDAADESEGLVDSVNGATGAVVLAADDIGVTDAGGYFTGTDVEAALQEAGADIADHDTRIDGTYVHSVAIPTFGYATSTGSWVLSGATNLQSDGVQNRTITWKVPAAAGTYTFRLVHVKGSSRGIYTVSIDGSTIGTIDGYDASSASALSEITGVSIGTTEEHSVTITMATKNASSSDYFAIVTFLALARTA